MSYKGDMIISMLDEIMMRLDRLERALIKGEEVTFTETVKEIKKPKLSVVTDLPENNIVEFDPH